MSDQVFALFVLALVPLGWAFYLLPAIVAFRRQHPNRWLILAVNVMLGATGIGWAVALVLGPSGGAPRQRARRLARRRIRPEPLRERHQDRTGIACT